MEVPFAGRSGRGRGDRPGAGGGRGNRPRGRRGKRGNAGAKDAAASGDDAAGDDDAGAEEDLEAIKRAALANMHGFAGDSGGGPPPSSGFVGHGASRVAEPASGSRKGPGNGRAAAALMGGTPDSRAASLKARAARFASDSHPSETAHPATPDRDRLEAVAPEDRLPGTHIVGTCELMCPVAEREMRERKNDVELFERVDPANRNTSDPALCVKKYTRIVDNVTADMVRTRGALSRSVKHLYGLLDSRQEISFMMKSKFLWDRLRSVRQDLSLQAITDSFAMRLLEQMVRFAILSEHELCEETATVTNPDGHNSHLNIEQLAKTLTSLRHMYDDHAQRGIPNGDAQAEAEMFAYQLLLRIDSHGRYHVERREMLNDLRSARQHVLLSPDVQLALEAHRAYHANNIIAFFKLVNRATYLQACVLHKYFVKIRSRALEMMNTTLAKHPVPMKEVARLLHTDVEQAEAMAIHHGLTVIPGRGGRGGRLLVFRESGYIDPADEFPILRSSLVDCKRAPSYLAEVAPRGLVLDQSLSPAAGPAGTAFMDNIPSGGLFSASNITPHPAHHRVPDNTGMGPRLLAPTKEAVAVVSEQAARAVSSSHSPNSKLTNHGKQSLMASVKARQNAAKAAAEKLRADILAAELKVKQRKEKRASMSPVRVARESGPVPLAQSFLDAKSGDVDVKDQVDLSSKGLKDLERPPFSSDLHASTVLPSTWIPPTDGKMQTATQHIPGQSGEINTDRGIFSNDNNPDLGRSLFTPKMPTQTLLGTQDASVESAKSGKPHVAERIEVSQPDVSVIARENAARQKAELERRAREQAELERRARETAELERRAREKAEMERRVREQAEMERRALEAAKMKRRAEKARMARLKFAFARWWAHSRMQAYQQHEGRIFESCAGAAPTPGIISSTAMSSLVYRKLAPSAALTSAVGALKDTFEVGHKEPLGRALDLPKLIYETRVDDGREATTSHSYGLGHVSHWKLLLCSGGESGGNIMRSPHAAMTSDWLRVKLSRGGGKGTRADDDGTILSLYASRIQEDSRDGSTSADASGQQFNFSRHLNGTDLQPIATATPSLWVCVRDVPSSAPASFAGFDTACRSTSRSDASAILFVMDLSLGDVNGTHDWDSTHVVPETEKVRLKEFVASFSMEHEDDRSVVPMLIFVIAASHVNGSKVVMTVNGLVSATLAQHSVLQRHPFNVKVLQPPLDDGTVVVWDKVLTDGLKWAAALSPPTIHLIAAHLRDEVADVLKRSVDAIVSSSDSWQFKLSFPEDCVSIFNDAVQRVRIRVTSAAGDALNVFGNDSGKQVPTVSEGSARRIPSEFITARSVTSLDSAAADRVVVLLTILDGAELPPFPSMGSDAATRLHSYLSNLYPSEVLPPGAVAASFAKAGYANGPDGKDPGIAWLTIFSEIFSYRLAAIETAQAASGVGPAYIFPVIDNSFMPTLRSSHIVVEKHQLMSPPSPVTQIIDDVPQENIEPRGMEVVCMPVDTVRKRKRSIDELSSPLDTELPTRLSNAVNDADDFDSWLAGAAVMDTDRSAAGIGSGQVHIRDSAEVNNLMDLLAGESVAAELLRKKTLETRLR